MVKKSFRLQHFYLFLLVAALLSACNLASSGNTSLTPQTGTSSIELTLTAFVQPTSTLEPTSTFTPRIVTATPAPGGIPVTGATPTTQPSPTVGATTASACDRAAFVSDITYADGSVVAPGATFVKTWRIKNNGSCAWQPGYSLVFVGNQDLGAPAAIALPNRAVAPGAMLDISVTFKAPAAAGNYESDWMLRNRAGQMFGVGPRGDGFLWVKIKVPGNSQLLAFKPGETSANVAGSVAANSTASYVVNAVAGQKMMVSLNAPNQPLALEILTPQGAFMAKAADQLTTWQSDLPLSGGYLVTVANSGAAANFNLTVTLPVRVTFPSGATALNLAGSIQPHAVHSYTLKALQKQTMTVTVQSDKNDVFLTIYGVADGTPYVRSASGQTTFTFQLPSTQDYVIQCESTGASPENYTVSFNVQ